MNVKETFYFACCKPPQCFTARFYSKIIKSLCALKTGGKDNPNTGISLLTSSTHVKSM